MLTSISDTTVDLQSRDRWVFDMFVGDDDGIGVAMVPTIEITLPAGSTSAPTAVALDTVGYYRVATTVISAGRYVATAIAAGYGATAFVAFVSTTSPATTFPDLDDVKSYLANGAADPSTEISVSDVELQDALDAEASAQRRVCEVPATYPADLAQALKRRVARNLAMRGIPLAVFQGDAETGSLTPPGRDSEVRRLEGPYRKLVQP